MTDRQLHYRFTADQRLSGRGAFAAVFAGRCRKNLWPLSVCGIPNQRDRSRLGLSINRKVGSAVQRNRIKRLIREAFRLGQHDDPAGYDLVVVVRPHDPLPLSEYRRILTQGIDLIDRQWRKWQNRQEHGNESQQPPGPTDESPR